MKYIDCDIFAALRDYVTKRSDGISLLFLLACLLLQFLLSTEGRQKKRRNNYLMNTRLDQIHFFPEELAEWLDVERHFKRIDLLHKLPSKTVELRNGFWIWNFKYASRHNWHTSIVQRLNFTWSAGKISALTEF